MTSCGFTKLTAFRGRQCANYEGSAGYWLGDRPAAQGDQTTLRRTGSAWQKVCYAALPPMSPTIAPKPILYVVEQASAAAFTCSESPPNTASNTVKIRAKAVSAVTVEKISLKRGVKSASLSGVRMRFCLGSTDRARFRPGPWFSTPLYTAQMGHWSESLVDELAQQVGGSPDRSLLMDLLAQAGRELDVLFGRGFHPLRRTTSTFEPNGLPFVDVPDAHVGSLEAAVGVWEVPDPVNREMATVLQVSALEAPAPNAAPIADGLWFAGQLVAEAAQKGALSGDYMVHWLGTFVDHDRRMEIFRRVMDPAIRFSVPILGVSIGGWWIQIARRLIWLTNESEDEGRLIELLLDKSVAGGEALPLAATEAVLIVARMTRHPADWAFSARIWTEGVRRQINRPWTKLATAVHEHGIPTITVDSISTPHEIACQVVLKGYWHGYISSEEPALANAVAMAYPRQVERIQRGTGAPDKASAAATLLEQLIRPGFDPAQGAEATRRYVRRKASIAVMQHRKLESPDRYPWTQIGISERRYYKLLPLFAQKINGRYDVDLDDVVARMKVYLDSRDRDRNIRTAALDLLQERGFSEDAARKWLQRHLPAEAVDAWPRGRRQ
jgi:hypothetical protein